MTTSSTTAFSTKLWVKRIVLAMIAVIIIAVVAGKTKLHLGSGGTDAYGWNLIETINCPMGKASWDKGQGWCRSQSKLEPGTYRLILREVAWELAFWDQSSQRVVGYRAVPALGIHLSEWQGTTDERRFLKEAPAPENRRLGSIVMKIGNEKAFDPFQKGSFEVERKESIFVIPNLPPCENVFIHNRGRFVVEIEKEI